LAGSAGSFPKASRLLAADDFRRVFAGPRKSADGCFTVLYRPSAGEHARLGLAISKRRLRRAVDRNRIKRIVRESFRAHRSHLPPVDVVVLAGPRAGARDNAALHASLRRHWERLGAPPQASSSRAPR
jgi:ribonuclease P protein component